jgi:hypothetical protein
MNETRKLPCFGGFAVTLEYGVTRTVPTLDIDVLDVAPPNTVDLLIREGGLGSPLAIEHKVYLDFVGVANPPYDYESRLRPMYPGAFRHLHLLQLAEKIPFDLDLFEKRYREELRDNTTGRAEDNDIVFDRWKDAILENRARKNRAARPSLTSYPPQGKWSA